jgi:aryl-alcohol dehydrogenase-like predicted oxidoreductase
MKMRTIPGTDLTLSEIGFGMWTVATSWWGDFTDEAAIQLMRKAYDEYGITFFDAADTYGNGRSETLIAKAFGAERDKIVIGSKFAYDIYDNPEERIGQRELPQKTTPEYIRYALEETLKRLNTDYLDLYQVHNAKMEHIEDNSLFDTLEALKQDGKIRHYGVALGPAIGWLAEGVRAIRERQVDTLMIIYSLLEQHPGDAFIEESRRHNNRTGFIVRVPHASGMLEGHYTENTTFEKGDHRAHRPKHWLTNGLKKIEQLRFLETSDRTLGQMAIQFILAEPTMTSVLPNIYNEQQLHEFATAVDCPPLTETELATIRELVANNFGITDEPPMMYKGSMTHPDSQRELASV